MLLNRAHVEGGSERVPADPWRETTPKIDAKRQNRQEISGNAGELQEQVGNTIIKERYSSMGRIYRHLGLHRGCQTLHYLNLLAHEALSYSH
jgi:hypothetical protein